MNWWEACLWGLAGSAAVEALELYRAIQRVKGFPWKMPGEIPLSPYVVAVIIRNGLGAGLAAAFGVSGQIAGPLGAIAVGVAAPKIVEQLLRQGLAHPAVEPMPAPVHAMVPPPTDTPAPVEPVLSNAPAGQPGTAIEGEAGVA
ncbi:hypothetical protein ABZ612_34900 [Streptomyces avermitilis]|uniref:hypothetical protein n=1 Tax=Streptomyces avermitilis TaxID=33903 RepID=UPI0033FFE2AC